MITLTVQLEDNQALALAQLLKRITFSDLRSNAVDHDEAYLMVDAVGQVREALREVGYDPR